MDLQNKTQLSAQIGRYRRLKIKKIKGKGPGKLKSLFNPNAY